MNSLYTDKLVKYLGWLLIGLSLSWSVPSLADAMRGDHHAKLSTGSLAMSISPAQSTYTVGQSLTVTVTGGTPGTEYQAVLYAGNPASGTLLNNISVTTSEAGQNTVIWQAGQTSAYFVVRLGEGSQGAGRVLEVTNDNFTDYTDSNPFAIAPRSPLALTLSGNPTVGQSITATFTGGVEGEKYAILLYSDASYTTDLSGMITPTNGTDGTNTIVWQPGQTSASFDVRFESGSEGSGRILEITNLDFTHFVDSSPLTINTCTVAIGSTPSLTVTQGQSATLTASGADSFTWSTGETTASISVSVATSYSVTGTTGACSATASVALSVTAAPCALTAVLPASGSTVCQGSAVVVMATVGQGGTAYQWYKDGQSLGSAQQSPTLALGDVQPSQQGHYVLVATGCGSVSSAAFTLTVKAQPTVILTFPNNATVNPAGPTITIPAGQSLSYQVFGGVHYERKIIIDRINGYLINQTTTNATGIFPIDQLGSYTITVTGANGCQRTVQGFIQTQ